MVKDCKIEKSDAAFQRQISKQKVAAIENFYETAVSQPPIPGTVLLFTAERLKFEPVGRFENVGDLEQPRERFLVIDGQHRLAALHFFQKHRPDEAKTMHVPCIVFDGKSEDFAAEMFVIINSTPTRINKSHLVDLYERVSWAAPDKKLAARVVEKLYSEGDRAERVLLVVSDEHGALVTSYESTHRNPAGRFGMGVGGLLPGVYSFEARASSGLSVAGSFTVLDLSGTDEPLVFPLR